MRRVPPAVPRRDRRGRGPAEPVERRALRVLDWYSSFASGSRPDQDAPRPSTAPAQLV